MQPESITQEEAAEVLDQLVLSEKTVYLTLIFEESAVLIQTWGKLNERPSGVYFITNDFANYLFSPDRYSEIYRLEGSDAVGLRFENAPNVTINVLLLFSKEEMRLSTDQLAGHASDWLN